MWCTGLVALRSVGFSQTRDRTHVPCIGRQTPNPWTTREVQERLDLLWTQATFIVTSLIWPPSQKVGLGLLQNHALLWAVGGDPVQDPEGVVPSYHRSLFKIF